MSAAECDHVIRAIELLPAPVVEALAAALNTAPTVPALQLLCATRPSALQTVRRYIYSPARSSTPPRARIQVPETPPPVVRVDRTRRMMNPSPPLDTSPPSPRVWRRLLVGGAAEHAAEHYYHHRQQPASRALATDPAMDCILSIAGA